MDDKEPIEDRGRSYRLAFEDLEFLQSDAMRPLRLALEFSKIDLALQEKGIASTVVVFGSHHIVSPEQADADLAEARDAVALNLAKQRKRLSAWYQEARNFGRSVSERGGALAIGGMRQNVIVTGGGPGIMEAANRGAADAGAPSIGFNIVLPEEQEPNPFTTPELTFRFHYFGIRKMHFAMRANALAVFPGGFGTLDELFEILTLKQTRKTALMPVILFSRDYWRSTVNFEALAELEMIDAETPPLYEIVDTAEEAWSVMVGRGLMAHTPLRED
ncbi:MAG: LOG family protein [Methyloceanibacter sp.]